MAQYMAHSEENSYNSVSGDDFARLDDSRDCGNPIAYFFQEA
jgi:hypothetical protein